MLLLLLLLFHASVRRPASYFQTPGYHFAATQDAEPETDQT